MRKMKKRIQMILSMVLITVLLVGISGFDSLATENGSDGVEDVGMPEILEATIKEEYLEIKPYTMLTSCIIGVTCDSEGMHISISTGAVGVSSVLGVKDVKIWKKVFGGWSLVATSSGGESYNRSITGVDILYSNAVKGATYKITCVHYGDVDGYIEGENDSGEFVFTY